MFSSLGTLSFSPRICSQAQTCVVHRTSDVSFDSFNKAYIYFSFLTINRELRTCENKKQKNAGLRKTWQLLFYKSKKQCFPIKYGSVPFKPYLLFVKQNTICPFKTYCGALFWTRKHKEGGMLPTLILIQKCNIGFNVFEGRGRV